MKGRQSLAGVARADVTPPVGTMLEGYHRTEPSVGVLDHLYATVLVMQAGGDDPIALLAIDHIGLSVAYTDPLRIRVGERLGVGKEGVMACFSHTHSGPRATPGYVRSLSERVERAAGEAAARLRPARVGWGVGSVEAGVNRRPRGPDGRAFMGEAPERPVDRRLGVLRVDGADANPMAVLLWYGAHANVLKAESNVVSADWPGAARRVVECALGCPALVVYGADRCRVPLHACFRGLGESFGAFDAVSRDGRIAPYLSRFLRPGPTKRGRILAGRADPGEIRRKTGVNRELMRHFAAELQTPECRRRGSRDMRELQYVRRGAVLRPPRGHLYTSFCIFMRHHNM